MSANLLDGIKPQLNNGTAEDGGAWHVKQTAGQADLLTWKISGQAALATNQTVHLGISAKAASGSTGTLSLVVAYMDKAGNRNWAWTTWMSPTASWSRLEASATIPSGMTIYALTLSIPDGKKSPESWVTAPTMSYGSPVCLASSAHTPYATQDHVSVTYATKASLKVTDDSIKTEVSARAQTDRNVADLSSRLTQTANSLTSEISDRKSAITTVTGLANAAQSTADSASEQTVELSSRLDQTATDMTATIESKVQTVQQGVDGNASDVKDLNDRLSDEIRTRKSFMRFSEESSDPTLTLGQTDSPAQVKLTNKQLQFLYLNTVVAYMSGDALLINNAKILQQLQLGGFAFVPRQNGNLSLKWVGGDA